MKTVLITICTALFVNVMSEVLKAFLPNKSAPRVEVQVALDEDNKLRINSIVQKTVTESDKTQSEKSPTKIKKVKNNLKTKKQKDLALQWKKSDLATLKKTRKLAGQPFSYRIGEFRLQGTHPEILSYLNN